MKIEVGVVANENCDFLNYLERVPGINVSVIKHDSIDDRLKKFKAVFLLGSTSDNPDQLILSPMQRNIIEEMSHSGIKIFAECYKSMGEMYAGEKISCESERLICHFENTEIGLQPGELLDNYDSYYYPQNFIPKDGELILSFGGLPIAHRNVPVPNIETLKAEQWALWIDNNFMLSSFPLSNVATARYAPRDAWGKIVQFIVKWTCDLSELNSLPELPRAYDLGEFTTDDNQLENFKKTMTKAIHWYTNSGVLNNEGWKNRLYEGLSAKIQPDGIQPYSKIYRPDCAGETSLAFYTYHLLSQDAKSKEVSDDLEIFVYDHMVVSGGLLDGMLRWTSEAWGVCYGDDVARFLLGSLYKAKYSKDLKYLPQIKRCLDFLLRTTGSDGLRPARTDSFNLRYEDDFKRIQTQSGNCSSAHYNAYYMAALAFYGELANDEIYIDAAEKGLNSILDIYPKTQREHSETQELCRLILPLAILYGARPTTDTKNWLYRISNDLQRFRHESGAYLEWDSDYSAVFSRTTGTECSLLAENGDPVCDLLYSLNWLPLGFAHSWVVTGDPYFEKLWKDICQFFVEVQINSKNKSIDGAWARGIDVEKMEVFAMPNDAGWGPWAIESGWTVAEIIAGIGIGLFEQK